MELVLKGEYTGTMYHVGIDVLVDEGSVGFGVTSVLIHVIFQSMR